jgi:hypothetical protein
LLKQTRTKKSERNKNYITYNIVTLATNAILNHKLSCGVLRLA